MTSLRRTKIVATIGPASTDPDVLGRMIAAGMDVARLNTSHGTVADHIATAALVRATAEKAGRHVGVLMDLGGPKLRTGALEGEPFDLNAGEVVRFEPTRVTSRRGVLGIDYPALLRDVKPADRVLIDDGAIELVVDDHRDGGLLCRVIDGGALKAGRGVTFPDSDLTLGAITARDRECLAAGVEAGVDFLALSFVGSAAHIEEARSILSFLDAEIPIIAKIERRAAIARLDEIAGAADGLMVARGDLGVELPPEQVPIMQRRIIAAAGRRMIPVITATQMLESMTTQLRPTRAESSDVAHAVWDLSDALMLSGETAAGAHPVEAVEMMDRIIRSAEAEAPDESDASIHPQVDDHSYVIALAARQIVQSDANMKGIACFTRSGYSARLLSKVHPRVPIYGLTPTDGVCRQLALARGVVPVLTPFVETSEAMLHWTDTALVEDEHLSPGDEVCVVASLPVRAVGRTNFLKLHRLGETP